VIHAILGAKVGILIRSVFVGMSPTFLLSTSKGDPHLLEVRPDQKHATILFICEPGVKLFGQIQLRNFNYLAFARGVSVSRATLR
jgi:hypothetical protein